MLLLMSLLICLAPLIVSLPLGLLYGAICLYRLVILAYRCLVFRELFER